LVGAPLVGWPPVVRLPAVLVPASLLGVAALRPWRWNHSAWERLDAWIPTGRAITFGALGLTLLLSWIVLTRFQSGQINGVDFTSYFDRPCFQTLQGRPLLVETALELSQRSVLAHHAYWGMFPLCAVYALHASPLWLLAVSVVAVVAGAGYIVRTLLSLGAGGLLAAASGLAFALNDNTARALNYGFHPEVLYAWCIPWLLYSGLQRNRHSFMAAVLVCLCVKEDAVLVLFAVSIAVGLHRFRSLNAVDRAIFMAAPPILGLTNLVVYHCYIVPALTPDGRLVYGEYWADYGSTPFQALVGVLAAPWSVFVDTLMSGFFRDVILPTLFLPLLAWRWILGIVPMVAVYSAASYPQLHMFSLYYAIPLVPFLTVAASIGAINLTKRALASNCCSRVAASMLILAGALLVGSGDRGYSVLPWKTEVAAVPDALAQLADERLVLVQSGLYPHSGYDARIQLLTPITLHDSKSTGAAVLVAPAVGAFPFSVDDILKISQLPAIRSLPAGLVAVRIPAER